MINAIYGTKIGMTQLFDEDGQVTPVTVIKADPNKVCQVKTTATDGYEAVQLGFGTIKEKKVNKRMQGHFAKSGVSPMRYLSEVRVEDASEHAVGDTLTVEAFNDVDKVDVTGVSKGKGFTGAIKRHNQHRLKETHGSGPVARQAGSMGACSSPSRIFKGKGMAGHMGAEKVTVQNLEIVKVDSENNLIAIKGAIPGIKGGIVVITDSVKA